MMDILKTVLVIVLAYFLGNISPSTMLARRQGIDIKKAGSGNAGATNALRVLGKKAALITLAVDILKGFLAVRIGYAAAGESAGKLCALSVFSGHIWPAAFRFRGGKGVSTAFGALLGVNWTIALCCLGVMALFVLLTGMVSLGSIAAALAFPVFTYIWEPDFLWIGIPMAVILICAHRGNIVRIIQGKESRLGFKEKRKRGNR